MKVRSSSLALLKQQDKNFRFHKGAYARRRRRRRSLVSKEGEKKLEICDSKHVRREGEKIEKGRANVVSKDGLRPWNIDWTRPFIGIIHCLAYFGQISKLGKLTLYVYRNVTGKNIEF